MKKTILVLLAICSLASCSKKDVSPEKVGSGVNSVNHDSKSVINTLCYVTYDAISGNSYLVKFTDPISTPVNIQITGAGFPGQKVTGGIARKKNVGGTYDYFITTCTAFNSSTQVYQRQINISSGVVTTSTPLCATANTLLDYKNYLLDNYPGTWYYYRSGTDIKSHAVGLGVPSSTTTFTSGHYGSICYGAGNFTAIRPPAIYTMYTGQATNITGLGSGTDIYLCNSTAGSSSLYSSNSYINDIATSQHAITIDDPLNGTVYLAYNGSYAGGMHTIIAKGLLSSATFPSYYTYNFPCGLSGGIANISDLEVVY